MGVSESAILRAASRFAGLALTALTASVSRSSFVLSKGASRSIQWPSLAKPDPFVEAILEMLPAISRRQLTSVFREGVCRMAEDPHAKTLLGPTPQYRWFHVTVWHRWSTVPTVGPEDLRTAVDGFVVVGSRAPGEGPYWRPEFALEFIDAAGNSLHYFRSDGGFTAEKFSRATLCHFAEKTLLPRLRIAADSSTLGRVPAEVPPFAVGSTVVDSAHARVLTLALPPADPLQALR